MPLPPGISTGTVTFGQAVSLIGGGDTAMTIEIKPTHNVVHAATGIQLLDFAETVKLDEGVPGSITLPHTDQAGFIDAAGNAFSGWAYIATGNWRRGNETRTFTKRFQILSGQNSIDLDLLPNGSITVPVSAPVLPVTSFLGKTGAIEAEDLTDLGVGGGGVADGGVTTAKLATDAVTSDKIASGAVNGPELGQDAVTASKIANDAVARAKLAEEVRTELDGKLSKGEAANSYVPVPADAGLTGQVLVKTADGTGWEEAPSGGGVTEGEVNTKLAKVGYGIAKPGRFALSGGPNSYHSAVGNLVYRPSVVLPVTTTRWRLCWRNYNITASSVPASTATSMTFGGFHMGAPALDATGVKTNNFAAAPLQALPSVALPVDGSQYTSPWVTDAGKQFQKGTVTLISTGLAASAGFQWARAQVVVPYAAVSAAALVASAAQQNLAMAGTTPMYGDWWIEYEFDGSAPIGLHIGDSLTDGQAAGAEQIGSHVNQHAVRQSIAASSLAVSGITLQIMAGWPTTHHFWRKYGLGNGWTPDYAVLWAGTNDIFADRTLAQMQADCASVLGILRGFGISNIYVATAAPRALSAPREAVRTAWNAWLYTRPFGILGVFDYSRTVEATPGAATLLPAYDSGDTTHFTALGQARIAEILPSRLGA